MFDKNKKMHVWVGELGAYNAGYLIGEWVEVPVDADEIENILKKIAYRAIQICGTEIDREDRESWEKVDLMEHEFYIGDTDNIIFEVGEYDSLFRINEKAEEVAELSDYQYLALQAHLECCDDPFDIALENIKEERFRVYEDCWDMVDVAQEIVLDNGFPEEFLEGKSYVDINDLIRDAEMNDDIDRDLPDVLKEHYAYQLFGKGSYRKEMYFDYAYYARDLEINGTFHRIKFKDDNGELKSYYVELY